MRDHRRITNIPLLRQANIQTVLRAIWQHRSVTRRELSELTSLTAPTISNITTGLLERRLVTIEGKGTSTGGRQPEVVRFNPLAYYAIGLSLGVYQIKGIVTDLYGNKIQNCHFTADYHGRQANLIPQLQKIVRDLFQAFPHRERILGIGVSVPGTVDDQKGVVLNTPIIGEVYGVNLKESLEGEFGLPTYVDNNANLCALNETIFGKGKGKRFVVFLFAGFGIGAGLVINGEIYTGARDASGEIGHTVIEMNGKKCYCGSYGCLETVASYPAVFEQYQQKLKVGAEGACPELIEQSFSIAGVEKIFGGAKAGDLIARGVLEETGSYIGVAIANILNLLNPDIVIIGGDYLQARELLAEPILKAVRLRSWKVVRDTEVVFTDFGLDADVYGGAALVIKRFFEGSPLGLEFQNNALPAP